MCHFLAVTKTVNGLSSENDQKYFLTDLDPCTLNI